MPRTVNEVISALKARFAVETDADLARKLRVDKSTVSSWKSRGSVPSRFEDILDGKAANGLGGVPLPRWTPDEVYAFNLALFRLAAIIEAKQVLSSYRSAMQFFDGEASDVLWELATHCQLDLMEIQCDGKNPAHTALAIAIHDDLQNPEASVERDIQRIRSAFGSTDAVVAKL